MLHAMAFDRVGVVVSDIYFLDPDPAPGQEGPEQGVRLELRTVQIEPLRGSVYSASPIAVGQPIWRVDLLESVDAPGSFDRTHHHPRFSGWEPGRRVFDTPLSSDPLGWLDAQLADPGAVLERAAATHLASPADVAAIREARGAILSVVRDLLDGVRAGRLGQPPDEGSAEGSARVSWL